MPTSNTFSPQENRGLSSRSPGIVSSCSWKNAGPPTSSTIESLSASSCSFKSAHDMLDTALVDGISGAVLRQASDSSCQSPISEGSTKTLSVDSHGPISYTDITRNFTCKWPHPSTMKRSHDLKTKDVLLADDASPILEDGHGLALIGRSPSKWTPFKTYLLVSIVAVFAYGSAALICAIMTWFNGK